MPTYDPAVPRNDYNKWHIQEYTLKVYLIQISINSRMENLFWYIYILQFYKIVKRTDYYIKYIGDSHMKDWFYLFEIQKQSKRIYGKKKKL